VKLNISRNHVTDKGAKAIGEVIQMNTALKCLIISFDCKKCDALAKNLDSGLLTANLSEGEKSVLEALSLNTSLNSLDISECNFRDQFFFTTALMATMECNNTVTSLKMRVDRSDCCRIVHSGVVQINRERRSRGLDILHILGGIVLLLVICSYDIIMSFLYACIIMLVCIPCNF